MIGRRSSKQTEDVVAEPKRFDDFELRLGDVMRGERATMGKSLLDVQRELRIKASYISAIENSDPEAFDTPGFIAGYVRSYARYLGMDPDEAFAIFCEESGFSVAHGMSAEASVVRKAGPDFAVKSSGNSDLFAGNSLPFAPAGEPILSGIDLRAVGSIAVLVALIGGITYGGWSVLQEVQRVQVAPVEETAVVLADIDPLNNAQASVGVAETSVPEMARAEALDRLYRPQALDVPVLVARDAPIVTLDPQSGGLFQSPPQVAEIAPALPELEQPFVPQVVEMPSPELQIVAVRPAWVRIKGADGTTLFEGVMEPGSTWIVPAMETPPSLRVGESGAVYFAMDGQHYGPAGPRGTVTSNIALDRVALADSYAPADPAADAGLESYIAALQAPVTNN